MTIWPPDPASLSRPVYRALAKAVVDAIAAGALRPGDRLPTHRDLAFQLGLSVQTVSRAYEALIRADVITGEVGRGTFVKSVPGDLRAPPYHRLDRDEEITDCSILTPVLGEPHARAMDEVLAAMTGDLRPELLYSFRPRVAMQRHCEQGADWLHRCGLKVRPDQVLVTNGNTPAMTTALLAATSPGDLVVTEALGHHTLMALTGYLGLKLAGLPCDDQGILPAAFDAACRQKSARALYVMPAGVNPQAHVMGPDRREALVEVARRHDVAIIENDAWGPLEPARTRPIAALAPERTYYFTGLSKCLLPGLRLGYLAVPERHVTAAQARHLVTNWMATGLMAEIGSRWIADGTAERLLHWQRRALQRRNLLAQRVLDGVPVRGNPRGLHLWLPLPAGWDESAFVNAARLAGVAVAPGGAFAIARPHAPPGVRICLGAPTERSLETALATLARLARSRPETEFLTL